jgi:diacylglycerol kinase (ATP)
MRKAVLLYNPESGRKREQRAAHVEAAAAVLRAAGVDAQAVPTRSPGSAPEQAREAIAAGCDTIFACGGDGTIHEVLQGMVGADAALGVIPLGTGNALASDLKLPRDPAAAARAALAATPQRIALGRIEYQQSTGERASRYFMVVAGIGADAALVYRLALGFKQRYGMFAYYSLGFRLWLQHRFAPYTVEFLDAASGQWRRETVTQVLAVRVTQFGGLLRKLAPGAALARNDMQLVLFKTHRRRDFFRYMTCALLERDPAIPGRVELVHSTEARCLPLEGGAADRRVYLEADGELLGTLPVSIVLESSALNLLIPETTHLMNAEPPSFR